VGVLLTSIGSGEAKVRTRVDRRMYFWASLACALIAITGFSRSYYLKFLFVRPELPALLHVHGAIMSAWCVLFIVQTYFVATHQVPLHRRLGIIGAFLAILVVVAGTYLTVEATAREVRDHVVRQFHFLFGLNLVNLVDFSIFVATALALRARPQFHKRLMLLATVTLLAPAVARIVLLFTHNGMSQLWAFDFCILACVVMDTVVQRRLHPAFGWGAGLVLGSFHLTFIAVGSKWWLPFVAWTFS
jgi:hypothetical protein